MQAARTKTGHRWSPEPDWALVHRELKRKHMTLQILWDEYISRHPDGYRYSRYCDLYRGWAMKPPVTIRQDHAAGDKLFVDYAGDTVTVLLIGCPARHGMPTCSWRLWERPAFRSRRRAGVRHYPTGLNAISKRWSSLAVRQPCWLPIMPSWRSSRPASFDHPGKPDILRDGGSL